jgi:hypothetical protein
VREIGDALDRLFGEDWRFDVAWQWERVAVDWEGVANA